MLLQLFFILAQGVVAEQPRASGSTEIPVNAPSKRPTEVNGLNGNQPGGTTSSGVTGLQSGASVANSFPSQGK